MDTTGEITCKGDVLKRGLAGGNVFELLNQDRPRPEYSGRSVNATSGSVVLTSSGQCFTKGHNIVYDVPLRHRVTVQFEYAGVAVFHVTPCSLARLDMCLYDLGPGAMLLQRSMRFIATSGVPFSRCLSVSCSVVRDFLKATRRYPHWARVDDRGQQGLRELR